MPATLNQREWRAASGRLEAAAAVAAESGDPPAGHRPRATRSAIFERSGPRFTLSSRKLAAFAGVMLVSLLLWAVILWTVASLMR
jgi:hypothetical protein